MKINKFIIFGLLFVYFLFSFNSVLAEDKSAPGGIIPKLPKTANDPELFNNFVFPEWGPVCQRYTYTVTYRDKEGRLPEYMRIIFNGEAIEMEKANSDDNDYKKGVRYEYKFVPNKVDGNFYYFEASNGVGKTRASIIDSPDNGPVLFESAFDNNEIVLINSFTGDKLWSYSTKEEWVGGVALSDDGQYLAALTSRHVYLFSTDSEKPIWQYQFNQSSPIGGGSRGNGIAISKDGNQIVAALGMEVALFDRNSSQPVWKYQAPAIAVAISKDGQYLVAGVVKQDVEKGGNVVLIWDAKSNQPIREFGADSNFHDVSLSADGQYFVASTGCPDRKAYLFSKDNPDPIIKSERLTFDSPVSKSKISADGSWAAFATEGGPDSSVVVLFNKNSPTPVWKFDNQKRNSSRAMSLTPDGQFIAAATMKGDVYLLNKDSNKPVKQWQLNSSIGALDIADDANFIALGGSDNQVWILSKNGGEKKIQVSEFVQSLDISAGGKLIAAGTGGSVYFFEEYLSPNKNKVFECQTIIEPAPKDQLMQASNQDGQAKPNLRYQTGRLPGMLFGFGFIGLLMFLGIFTGLRKLAFLEKSKLTLWKLSQAKPVSSLHLTGRKVNIILSILTAIFLLLTLGAVFMNRPGEAGSPQEKDSGTCGNNLCEQGLGETRQNCPKDCSGGD